MFLESQLCRWIEEQQWSYYTNMEYRPVLGTNDIPEVVVYLTLTEEDHALLKLKITDPKSLSVVHA